MDPQSVPPELKNEGADWFAIFNPAPSGPEGPGGQLTRKRNLDVHLVHTLMHERLVCHLNATLGCSHISTQRGLLRSILRGRQVPRHWLQPDSSDL